MVQGSGRISYGGITEVQTRSAFDQPYLRPVSLEPSIDCNGTSAIFRSDRLGFLLLLLVLCFGLALVFTPVACQRRGRSSRSGRVGVVGGGAGRVSVQGLRFDNPH